MLTLKWRSVTYENSKLIGDERPEDGTYNVWIDKDRNICYARFDYGENKDRFFPECEIKEEDIRGY